MYRARFRQFRGFGAAAATRLAVTVTPDRTLHLVIRYLGAVGSRSSAEISQRRPPEPFGARLASLSLHHKLVVQHLDLVRGSGTVLDSKLGTG